MNKIKTGFITIIFLHLATAVDLYGPVIRFSYADGSFGGVFAICDSCYTTNTLCNACSEKLGTFNLQTDDRRSCKICDDFGNSQPIAAATLLSRAQPTVAPITMQTLPETETNIQQNAEQINTSTTQTLPPESEQVTGNAGSQGNSETPTQLQIDVPKDDELEFVTCPLSLPPKSPILPTPNQTITPSQTPKPDKREVSFVVCPLNLPPSPSGNPEPLFTGPTGPSLQPPSTGPQTPPEVLVAGPTPPSSWWARIPRGVKIGGLATIGVFTLAATIGWAVKKGLVSQLFARLKSKSDNYRD